MDINELRELVNDGISFNDAVKAYNMSSDGDHVLDVLTNSDSEATEQVFQLVDEGHALHEAIKAVNMSLNDGDFASTALVQLISMGFDENVASKALAQCNDNIPMAVQYILNDVEVGEWNATTHANDGANNGEDVNNQMAKPDVNDDNAIDGKPSSNVIITSDRCSNVKNCPHVKSLSLAMRKYDAEKDNTDHDFVSLRDNLVNILDSFYHSVKCHDQNDEDFEYIYQSCGGLCQLSTCGAMQRQYKNANDYDENTNAVGICLDNIHCHYRHAYDKFRLTPSERKQLHKNDNDEKKQNDTSQFKNILNNKKSKLAKHKLNCFGKRNKFVLNSNPYCYSFNFNYWDHCYDAVADIFTPGYTESLNGYPIKYLYVVPKYNNLKEELLHNPIATVSAFYFNNQMKKAKYHQGSVPYKKSVAVVNKTPLNMAYLPHLARLAIHPSRFGYADGDRMLIDHLLVIMIYCDQDGFQRGYSSTFRAVEPNDTFLTIRDRHRNFHHFAKRMKEAVEVFGTMYSTGPWRKMYHGIDSQLVFNDMHTHIYVVMSTTTSEDVAKQFAMSSGHGLTLELIPSSALKYFECYWLSTYSNEQECLFIGGLGAISIVNIQNALTGHTFKVYVEALRVISSMIGNMLFNPDPSMIQHVIHEVIHDVSPYINLTLSPECQNTVKQIIDYQLSRRKLRLDPYIDRVIQRFFHCQQKVTIGWTAMNCVSLYQWEPRGYIGYRFLFPYFCKNCYEGLDLELIHTLFPSLEEIALRDVSSISSVYMDAIIKFIQTYPESKIAHFIIAIDKKCGHANVVKQFQKYKQILNPMGWSSVRGIDERQCVIYKISNRNKDAIQKIENVSDLSKV